MSEKEQIKTIDDFCDDKIEEWAYDDDITFREMEKKVSMVEEVRMISKAIVSILSKL